MLRRILLGVTGHCLSNMVSVYKMWMRSERCIVAINYVKTNIKITDLRLIYLYLASTNMLPHPNIHQAAAD